MKVHRVRMLGIHYLLLLILPSTYMSMVLQGALGLDIGALHIIVFIFIACPWLLQVCM